jgi:hypothetical protein
MLDHVDAHSLHWPQWQMGQFYRRNIDATLLFVGTRNPSEALVASIAPFGLDYEIIAFLNHVLSLNAELLTRRVARPTQFAANRTRSCTHRTRARRRERAAIQ